MTCTNKKYIFLLTTTLTISAGKTAKSILISCGARLAPFDIQEVRDITAYDELQLDTLGDKKTALFLIMSDTDATFNFLISMIYTQLFNLLCEKADDVYGGRLPVHVRCLIDEAANIGQIPNLEKLVATIRSREISACLVLQAQSQLSDDEYAAARASTLNAHYTSPTVIRSIYDAVGQMGFETGNILEPAMGIGNFFGMLPPEMQSSRLYGVELDSITGRIAQKLYPNAEIKVAGFETTDRRDFYDLAVGNVPFGNYKVSDKPYDKLGFSIHNYFFAKALDQVRPGGVVAFVTSRYTMDSKNSDARRYLAQRAELLGAIRLPNDAFKKNAGTEVVSDIIFLQKRDHPIDIVPDWVHLNRTEEGHTMNSYFVDHPEMVLGDTVLESTPYGKDDITVRPIPGAELSDLLKEAVSHIQGTYQAVELPVENSKGKEAETIPATPDVKNYSYAVVDGEVYFRENSIMDMNNSTS